jgi:subtilisin family serine protease
MPKDPQELSGKPDPAEPPKPEGGVRPRAAAAAAPASAAAKPLQGRKKQYLIAAKNTPGVQPFAVDLLEASLHASPEVEVLDTLVPRGVMGLMAAGTAGAQKVIVAKMSDDTAHHLKQNAGPQLVVEANHPLVFAMPDVPASTPVARDPGVIVPHDLGFTATVTVTGNGAPLAGADVYLFGTLWPVQGTTDANGQVTLTLMGESPETVRALYVKPKADYWSFYLQQPAIIPGGNNVVSMTPLSQTIPGFPAQQVLGWGQRAMRLDQIPANFKGRGVKVGVIDSGAATTHRDLQQQIKAGFDVVAKSNQSWSDDTVFHGSHCAGVIAGRADNNVGIRGFAPEADVIVSKIFPGGMFSHLLSALDFCIEQQVDIINLSLGSDQVSEILEQRLQKAKDLGIACIVAAGNTGGGVQFPASSASVLAVSAIGKRGEFPPDSYHATVELTGPAAQVTSDGFFAAQFSCFGPEIGVCGPGVAVVSSVPPDGYAAWDGTSMAAPHITGIAALVLAHHPDFQDRFKTRNAQRVERLFEILRQSARQLNLGDRNRTGAGLPDCVVALNLQLQTGTQPSTQADLLQRLLAGIQAGSSVTGVPVARTAADLRSSMQQAGLLPGNGGAAAPQAVPAGIAPFAAAGPQPPAASTDALKAAMQTAGLFSASSSPAPPRSGSQGPQLARLADAMKQAGLL